MAFITKRRLVSLASASALIATMAVAAAPAATLADVGDTVVVNGTTLTVMHLNPTAPVTGPINASGYDIAVYYGPGHTGTVSADISGALWYGIVADGANVTVTGSQIHNIGDVPFNGVQRGIGVFYTGASGTISGNTVSDYQKGGIVAKNGGSVTIRDNTVTGLGPVGFIAQNGIQVSFGTSARLFGNDVSANDYTPGKVTATGLLIYKAGGVSGQFKAGVSYIKADNDFHGNETNVANYGKGGAGFSL